jgi:hypothetical protein
MITIKAIRSHGGEIEWNYDRPQQCAKLWKELCETGRAPDTGDSLTRAYYFNAKCKPGDGPSKVWMA